MSRYNLVNLAYDFLLDKEKNKISFTIEELPIPTKWITDSDASGSLGAKRRIYMR